uniref:growth/differentiation factor 9-like n=1 Tax=Myxine glutinosa TaxID=7769 RepID=UPI00358E90AE
MLRQNRHNSPLSMVLPATWDCVSLLGLLLLVLGAAEDPDLHRRGHPKAANDSNVLSCRGDCFLDELGPAFPLFKSLERYLRIKERLGKTAYHFPNDHHLQYMRQLYYEAAGEDGRPRADASKMSNTVRLLKPAYLEETCSKQCEQRLTFNMTFIPKTEHLVQAYLVYSLSEIPPATAPIICTFLCVGELKRHLSSTSSIGLTHHFHHGQPQTRWAELDITSETEFWDWPAMRLADKTASVHVIVKIDCAKGGYRGRRLKVDVLFPPSLLLYLNDGHRMAYQRQNKPAMEPKVLTNSRPRRAALHRPSQALRGSCRLVPLRVTFSQLGWDGWIIAPSHYDAGVCRGDCPRGVYSKLGVVTHSLIQALMREQVGPRVPPLACVPASYGPMSVLAQEKEIIAYKEYANMIAQDCTCR